MRRVAIIDYGMGNLVSVASAVARLGWEPEITRNVARLQAADRLILPGVGAFGDAMRNMRAFGLIDALADLVAARARPILGICLGAQLMMRESEEFGRHEGLGWFAGRVRRIPDSEAAIRVPHVGWNDAVRARPSRLFAGVTDDALFYYVHSFCIVDVPEAEIAAECDYGLRFVAAVERGPICATQFHPEKSQRHGLAVLANFLGEAA